MLISWLTSQYILRSSRYGRDADRLLLTPTLEVRALSDSQIAEGGPIPKQV